MTDPRPPPARLFAGDRRSDAVADFTLADPPKSRFTDQGPAYSLLGDDAW